MAELLTGYAEKNIVNPKIRRRRKSDGANWSTVAVAWEAFNATNVANYGIVASETGGANTTGEYTCADPDPATPGDFIFYAASGASLTVSDLALTARWQDPAGPRTANTIQLAGQTVTAAAGVTFPTSLAATGAAMTLTSGERNAVATALLDLVNGIEAGLTPREALRLILAVELGKRSNVGTTAEQYDAANNPGTPRVIGNLDSSGNGTPILSP